MHSRLKAGGVLRDQCVHPAGLRQSRRQCRVQRLQIRTLLRRPPTQAALQPGERGGGALGFGLDHFRVQRQRVQHLATGQPFQGHLAAVRTAGQHRVGKALHQRGQQTQAIRQAEFAVLVQARPQVVGGDAQVLAALGQQLLRQLGNLLGIGTRQFVDFFAHALEVIVVAGVVADRGFGADGV